MAQRVKPDTDLQDRESAGWDAFVGPTQLMTDDRYPPMVLPAMMTAHAMALAAEMNGRFIRAMAGLPPSR